jgi:Fe-S cluster assembly protein SufD
MNNITDQLSGIRSTFESLMNDNENRYGHDVVSLKTKSFETFEKIGLPGRKNEEWKYSPVRLFLQNNMLPRTEFDRKAELPEDLHNLRIPGLDAYYLVIVNGVFIKMLSSSCFNGFSVVNVTDGPESEYYKKIENTYSDPFIPLCIAGTDKRLTINIPDKAAVNKPIVLQLISTGKDSVIDNFSINIKAGKSSSVQIVKQFINTNANILSNTFTTIDVRDNAKVETYDLQENILNGPVLANQEVQMGRDAVYHGYVFTTTGKTIRNTNHVYLNAGGAEANLYGLYQLKSKTHVDNRTLVDHRAPHCNSNETYKGVVSDEATGIFNGKVIVRPDAQKTNAFQHNPNILLSDRATVNSKPQLEIFADDVKCSHGATSGQIDEEAIFYLRTRGLGLEDAKALIIYAFANEVVEQVRIPELKKHLQMQIQGNLNIHE